MTIWPWGELRRSREQCDRHKQKADYWMRIATQREAMALQALRDLAAANKGIRRLRDKLDKKEAKGEKPKEAHGKQDRIQSRAWRSPSDDRIIRGESLIHDEPWTE